MKVSVVLKEFQPAIRFLTVFLATYFVLNLIYGIWIESLGNKPDAVTRWTSAQSAALAQLFGYDASVLPNETEPKIGILNSERIVINVFEGCNGLNVMIVFVAFIVAFGGAPKKMGWFIPMGFMVVHITNLVRILLLYFLADQGSSFFYYFHKYFFTAAIYVAVFVLWWIWIVLNNGNGVKTSKSVP